MKVRHGFVSNSSSTSFCILGVCASSIEGLNTEQVDLYDLLEDSELDYQCGIEDYYDDFVIGISPSSLDENLTIKQSKERIADLINKKFGTEFTSEKITFHTDGGREG
jgi:hypothetical protein